MYAARLKSLGYHNIQLLVVECTAVESTSTKKCGRYSNTCRWRSIALWHPAARIDRAREMITQTLHELRCPAVIYEHAMQPGGGSCG